MKYNKGFAPLILLAIIVGALVVGGGAVYFATKTPTSPKNTGINNYQPQENQNKNGVSNIPAQNTVTNNPPQQQTPPPTPTCKPSITVLSPNGGETFILGQTINIKWSSKCINSNEKISVSIYKKGAQLSQEGSPYYYITTNSGYYNWTIPKDISTNQYEVIVGHILTKGTAVYSNSGNLFTINSSETTQVKVYFAKKSFSGCAIDIKASDLDYFYRSIPKTQAVARASIEELLKGPTQEENNKGYLSDIPNGTILKSITITNGVALVDFNGAIENGTTSCSGGMKIWQIRQTLLQFPTITTVKFSVDGRTENIFQA